MAIIYHISEENAWREANERGAYEAPSLHTEGFIHCSEANQVQGVLQRYYAGRSGLLRLAIDTMLLRSPLRYDMAPSVNESFPHIYGPINLDAVVGVEMIS